MSAEPSDQGFAAFALPGQPSAFLVPLTCDIVAAGKPFLEPAQAKARASRTVNASAGDILAGNAFLALTREAPDTAAAAACLGALAVHAKSRAVLAVVHQDGESLDCTVETFGDPALSNDEAIRKHLTALLAERTGIPEKRIVPGRLAAGGHGGQSHDDFGTA